MATPCQKKKRRRRKEEEYLLETLAGKIAIYGYLRGLLQFYCAQKERMACICALARAARLQPRRCPLSSLVHCDCDCECCVRKNSMRLVRGFVRPLFMKNSSSHELVNRSRSMDATTIGCCFRTSFSGVTCYVCGNHLGLDPL